MALVVEDGTGKPDAEAYCDEAFATAHLAARGKEDAWDSVDDKEAALRVATDFLVQTYRHRWKGERKTVSQALDWPRSDVVMGDIHGGYGPYPALLSDSVVPVEVKRACAELALRAASAELLVDEQRQTVSETVGPISVTYAPGSSQQKRYESIERMLRPYLMHTSTVGVSRA